MIISIIGARPQFVKAAVLSKELSICNLSELIVHTGQHYDYKMSEVFFTELGLRGADINLNVGSGSHAQQTAEMLTKIESILVERKNEISTVVVFGDTNSTIAGALAAAKLNIPVAHVEAGLRSYNRRMPEEINRVTTDHISDLLFCSSDTGRMNLAKEGITKGVYVSGDIMLDAFRVYSDIALKTVDISEVLPKEIGDDFLLLTIHRQSNTEDGAKVLQVLNGLGQLSSKIVWPVHPRTRKIINGLDVPANVFIFEPFSYFEMMVVLNKCRKVLTDSGGLQKEAYWAKKPCVTMRSETEWIETLHNNWNVLCELNSEAIKAATDLKIDHSTWTPLYGNGNAGKQIAEIISN